MISNRIGLVLSGGGAKGAYEVGVVKCLSDMNISIDAISGASIGALNGAIVAAERDLNIAATHLQEIWYTLAAKSPIKVKGIEIGSYLGLMLVSGQTPLLTQKINTLFELAKLQAQFSENLGILKESPIHNLLDKYLNLKKIRTGLPLYVSVYESQGSLNDLLATLLAAINLVNTRPPQFLHIQSLDQTQQRNAILASAAIPLLFKARQVNKTYYADGGIGGWKNVRGNTPITPLIDSEKCSHLIVTHLTDGSLWDRQAFPDSTILEIRPRKPIKRQGMVKDLLGFNADNIQSWIEQGYEDTQRCVRNVKSALESRYIATQAKTRLNQTINRLDNDGFYID